MKIYSICNQDGLAIVGSGFGVSSTERTALVVEDVAGLLELRDRIDAYLLDGEVDGEVDLADPLLARAWISSKDVWRDYPHVARSTLSQACRDGSISGAELRGREWWFPLLAFQVWTQRTKRPGRKLGSKLGKRTKEQFWAKALGMTKADLAALE